MTPDPDERVSRSDLARALRVATEAQARDPSGESLSLAEAEQIASEVGITSGRFRAAIASIRSADAGGGGWLGPYGVLSAESAIARAVGPDEAIRMLASADVFLDSPAAGVDSPADGLWRMSDERSSLQVVVRGPETRLSATSDRRRMKLGLIGGGTALGSTLGVFIASSVAIATVGTVDAMAAAQVIGVVGGAAGGLAAGVASWRSVASRARTRILGALERMRTAT